MKTTVLFYLNLAGAIASILSLGTLLLLERWHATLALLTVIFFEIALLAILYSALNRYVGATYPDGYSRLSTFARYTTDGRIVRYEMHRHIQCRKAVMSSIQHQFKWTGSKPPRITSDLQTVRTRTTGGPGEYDCVELVFSRPLLYGEAAVVHHAMEMDDSDRASVPHVEFRVHEPVQLIAWRIELRNLPRSYRREARVTRRRIDAQFNAPPEHVARVPFDGMVRGYEHHITRPEPGYFYCLEWDR